MSHGLLGSGHPIRGQLVPPEVIDAITTEQYGDIVRVVGGFVVGALLVYTVGRVIVLPLLVRFVAARNRNNPTIQTAAETYIHAAIVLVALVAGVAAAGLWSLLTNFSIVVAALTLVVGAASQDVVGSLVSGLFLIADPDFNVGDWIGWPGGEGVVAAVDFRVTRIRTPDNESVSVPNTELTANSLRRPYGGDRYRVVESIGVAYGDVEVALRELVSVARADDRVLEDPAPTATLAAFEEDSIRVEAAFWIADPRSEDLVALRSDFRRRMKQRFDEVGVTIGPASQRELSGSVAVAAADDPSSDADSDEC